MEEESEDDKGRASDDAEEEGDVNVAINGPEELSFKDPAATLEALIGLLSSD